MGTLIDCPLFSPTPPTPPTISPFRAIVVSFTCSESQQATHNIRTRSRGITSFAVQLPPLHGGGRGWAIGRFLFELLCNPRSMLCSGARDSRHLASRHQPPPSLPPPPDAVQWCGGVSGWGVTGGGANLLWASTRGKAVGDGRWLEIPCGQARRAACCCLTRLSSLSRAWLCARRNSSRRGGCLIFGYRGRFLKLGPRTVSLRELTCARTHARHSRC